MPVLSVCWILFQNSPLNAFSSAGSFPLNSHFFSSSVQKSLLHELTALMTSFSFSDCEQTWWTITHPAQCVVKQHQQPLQLWFRSFISRLTVPEGTPVGQICRWRFSCSSVYTRLCRLDRFWSFLLLIQVSLQNSRCVSWPAPCFDVVLRLRSNSKVWK